MKSLRTFSIILTVLGFLSLAVFGRPQDVRKPNVKTRTIKGIVKSNTELLPGITINEIGEYENSVITDVDGKFELTVNWREIIYIQTSGMHFDRYLKYFPDEDFKTIVFTVNRSKKAERKSRRVYKEWDNL